MSEDFRYQRDITTAEETEAWLQQRQVELADFTDWLERRYWRSVLGEPAVPDTRPFSEADADLLGSFLADAVFSGALDQLGQQFGRRLVAHYHPLSETAPARADLAAVRQRFLDTSPFEPAEIAGWLEMLGRDPLWLEEMIALEAAYQAERGRLLTPARKAELLRGLRLPLTRFSLGLMEFDDLDAAREAALCLREDAQPISELAEDTGRTWHEISRFADDLPAALQQRLLSAAAGEVLEPEELGDGWRICRVAAKSEPTLDDPEVSERLEQHLLGAAFAERCHQHLRPSSTSA